MDFGTGSGFGFTRDTVGKLHRKDHPFQVILGRDVEIGRYTSIDKGSWRDTIIGNGTKIDSLVHIGHNARIGKHCLVVAGTVVGGSCNIGDYCFLGENCSIRQHITIGDHVMVGMGAVVLKDVPDNDIIAGNPAKSIKNKVNNIKKWWTHSV